LVGLLVVTSFLTVVDLSEEREVMTQKLGYWLSFISYHSKGTSVKSKVVVGW